MKKDREEVIEYINNCPNCYGVMLGESGKCKTLHVSRKRVTESIMVLAVDNKDIEPENIANQNMSFVFWDKLQGYQLKGQRILGKDIPGYYDEIDKLKDAIADKSDVSFVLCSINHIYYVTPGKFAGKLVQ